MSADADASPPSPQRPASAAPAAAHYDAVTEAWREWVMGEELHFGWFTSRKDALADATGALTAQLAAQSPSAATILLGQRILNRTEPVDAWALGALTNPSIAAGAHAIDGSTITEGDLEFAVNSLWPAMAL